MQTARVAAGNEVLLSNPERPEMVKGKIIAAHLSWLPDTIAGLEAFTNALPDGTRDRLRNGVEPAGWYPFADLIHVDRAIIAVTREDSKSVLAALGRHSADRNVPKYALEGDAHRFLALHAVRHSSFQNFGKATYRPTHEGGKFEIAGYTAYSPIFCGSSTAFFQRVLERFGYKEIQVRETECHCRGDKRCLYEMRWTGSPAITVAE